MLELIPIPEEIQEDIKEDLAVLNEGIEDLKASPFVTAPSQRNGSKKEVFKPPPPQEQEREEQEEQEPCEAAETPPPRKKTARKKELSEKQKAHLAKMRQKKIDKANGNLIDKGGEGRIEKTPQELEYMEAKEFDKWLSNMERFEKLIIKKRNAEAKQREIEDKKEAELEARIRKKIALENKQKQGIREPAPQAPQILQQQGGGDFGEYSSLFGY